MTREIHHISPNEHGGWCIRREGEERPFVNTDTKIKAIRIGIDISKKQDALVVIHEKEQRLFRPDSQPEIPFPFPFQAGDEAPGNESLGSNDKGSPAAAPGPAYNRRAYL